MTASAIAPGTPLCRLDDIPDLKAHEVVLGQGRGLRSIVLLRQGERVTAFRNSCPHFQIPLNARPDGFLIAGEGVIMCGFHSAMFRFSDGLCIDGPCKGARLEPVPVELRGEAVVVA